MGDYPKLHSDVEVTFIDGAIETYRITAGATIAPYLAREADESGVLSLLCGGTAIGIPLQNIRTWTITELPEEK